MEATAEMIPPRGSEGTAGAVVAAVVVDRAGVGVVVASVAFPVPKISVGPSIKI